MSKKRLSSKKSNRVKWVPDAYLCQVKLFLSEDCPSQVGNKAANLLQTKTSWMKHSDRVVLDDTPPGFGGKGYSQPLKQPFIPQIKWRRPPRVILNGDWHVVAGEHSEESRTQKCREIRLLEAVYPRVSAIPPSPTISPDCKECDYDDLDTPIIPVISIEEDDAVDQDSPTCPVHVHTCSTPVDPDVMAARSTQFAVALDTKPVVAVASTQYTVPLDTKPIVNEKSLVASNGLDVDVTAAASAAFTAIMSSNEMGSLIDTDLLIKILRDPKMIEKLSKDLCFSATSKPVPISESVCASIPSSTKDCHISAPLKPLDENHNMHITLRKSQPVSNSLPVSQEIQLPTIPMSRAKPNVIPFSEAAHSSPNTSLLSVSEAPIQSLQTSSLEPHALLSKQLENVHQLLQAFLSTPTMALPSVAFSAPEPDKMTSFKPASKEFEPKSVPPTSTSRDLGSIASPRLTDLRSVKHFTGSSFQSSSREPDKLPEISLSSMKPAAVKDTEYFRSLIKLHGMERQATEEKHTPQRYSSRVSEAVPGRGDTRGRVPRPCKYFNSSVGCRKGLSCPFQHDSFPRLRAGGMRDVDRSSKRVKLSSELA